MATQANKIRKPAQPPWVKFDRDPKTGSIILSRKDLGRKEIRLQFPFPYQPNHARILWADGEGNDHNDPDAGFHLSYNDVEWLAQALPELLSEMERAGISAS